MSPRRSVDQLGIYTGNASPDFARKICRYLNVDLGRAEVFEFSNENIFVKILDNVRERDVFLVQPTCSPVNKSIMELLIMIDAFKRASAGRITAVVPYYAYGRSDKKDQPRVPITARLVADMISVAGADRVLTMDLHQGQIQGFFNIPVDELTAVHILSNYFKHKHLEDLVVVTDLGFAKRARTFAELLDAPFSSEVEFTQEMLLWEDGIAKKLDIRIQPGEGPDGPDVTEGGDAPDKGPDSTGDSGRDGGQGKGPRPPGPKDEQGGSSEDRPAAWLRQLATTGAGEGEER